jgi:ribosome-binding factor A
LISKKPFKRTDRIGHQIQQILGEIVNRHINLSHLGFVTFLHVDVSPDIRNAKVFYSVLNPIMDIEDIDVEINKLVPAFKKFLGSEMHTKNIPDLHFYYDDTEEYRVHIESIFQSLDHSETDDL